MKLPGAPPSSTQFQNAPGSHVPKEFALLARQDPGQIVEMAETPAEARDLSKEALARQYVIVVDRSGSMAARDNQGTRWDSARLAVEKMVETVFHYDIDHNIPLFLFSDQPNFIGECTDPRQVLDIFRAYGPGGRTNLAGALDAALRQYAGRTRMNFEVVPGLTILVLLDGMADDPEAVKRVISSYADPRANYIDNHSQIAISFVQIGDDPSATAFLQDLDDNLPGLDVVDTKKDDILYTPGGLDQLLHDAIFD